VTHFLMVYDRPRGELVSITPFEDSKEALRARFAEERNHRHDPDLEIVVLAGESEDHLRTTHGRYFGQMHDLLAQMQFVA
jgi:cupin superfamily acireductone dioxygenase involved in methionine salvage